MTTVRFPGAHLGRRQREANTIDRELIARCMRLWDQGMDTYAIHTAIMEPESVVDRAISRGLELRRGGDDVSPRNWIVIQSGILNTVSQGGFEFFGPYTEVEAVRLQATLAETCTGTVTAVQLLYHPLAKEKK
jgi:hypothetical protein